MPVQNNKNTQDCLFVGLVTAEMNRYRAGFICVLRRKGSGGVKNKQSNTWIPASLLFSGLRAFS